MINNIQNKLFDNPDSVTLLLTALLLVPAPSIIWAPIYATHALLWSAQVGVCMFQIAMYYARQNDQSDTVRGSLQSLAQKYIPFLTKYIDNHKTVQSNVLFTLTVYGLSSIPVVGRFTIMLNTYINLKVGRDFLSKYPRLSQITDETFIEEIESINFKNELNALHGQFVS